MRVIVQGLGFKGSGLRVMTVITITLGLTILRTKPWPELTAEARHHGTRPNGILYDFIE